MTVSKFTTYRVSGGPTYAFRADLKRIGGRWDKPSKAWVVEVRGMSSVGQARYVLEQVQRAGCTVEEA